MLVLNLSLGFGGLKLSWRFSPLVLSHGFPSCIKWSSFLRCSLLQSATATAPHTQIPPEIEQLHLSDLHFAPGSWANRGFCSQEQPQQGSMWSEVRRLEGSPRDLLSPPVLGILIWRPYQYPWTSLFKENVEKIKFVRHLLYIQCPYYSIS